MQQSKRKGKFNKSIRKCLKPLSDRVATALEFHDILTIGHLQAFAADELIDFKGIKKKDIDEIKRALASEGYVLRAKLSSSMQTSYREKDIMLRKTMARFNELTAKMLECDELFDQHIKWLGLKHSLEFRLRNNGFLALSDFTGRKASEILLVKNLGKIALETITDALESYLVKGYPELF